MRQKSAMQCGGVDRLDTGGMLLMVCVFAWRGVVRARRFGPVVYFISSSWIWRMDGVGKCVCGGAGVGVVCATERE